MNKTVRNQDSDIQVLTINSNQFLTIYCGKYKITGALTLVSFTELSLRYLSITIFCLLCFLIQKAEKVMKICVCFISLDAESVKLGITGSHSVNL